MIFFLIQVKFHSKTTPDFFSVICEMLPVELSPKLLSESKSTKSRIMAAYRQHVTIIAPTRVDHHLRIVSTNRSLRNFSIFLSSNYRCSYHNCMTQQV